MRDVEFAEATFENVSFIECDLTRATFERLRISESLIRGCTLADLRGLSQLRGMRMDWNDILGHADLFAAELGIVIV
jgi:hypothetical protein